MSFPTAPAAMTPDWLGAVLGHPRGLRAFTATSVGTGQMCDSFRLTLDWTDESSRPASVIAKCPSHDQASRDVARLTGVGLCGAIILPAHAPRRPARLPRRRAGAVA